MNPQNALEYLPLIHALANGRTIQENYFERWCDMRNPSFNMDVSYYRIKPEPRMFDLWLDHDTGCLSTDELIREFGHVRFNSLERITVMEVLK